VSAGLEDERLRRHAQNRADEPAQPGAREREAAAVSWKPEAVGALQLIACEQRAGRLDLCERAVESRDMQVDRAGHDGRGLG